MVDDFGDGDVHKPFTMVMIMAVMIILLIGVSIYLYMYPRTTISTVGNVSNDTLIFNAGVVTSIAQLLNITNNCQVASLKYYNFTREIVDLACVRELLREQNITLK